MTGAAPPSGTPACTPPAETLCTMAGQPSGRLVALWEPAELERPLYAGFRRCLPVDGIAGGAGVRRRR